MQNEIPFQNITFSSSCVTCTALAWFCGQMLPCSAGFTQYLLRKKILSNDFSRYTCCQGNVNGCGLDNGQCNERSRPHTCAFMEGCFCPCCAASASRAHLAEHYGLVQQDSSVATTIGALCFAPCITAQVALEMEYWEARRADCKQRIKPRKCAPRGG